MAKHLLVYHDGNGNIDLSDPERSGCKGKRRLGN
jgi:hypothetical protein